MVSGQRHAPAALPPEETRCLTEQDAGWASGPACSGTGNFSPTVIRTPHRPVRSKSLYHLRYPGHQNFDYISYFPNILYMSHFSQ
jgi:hypothetical protein